MLTIERQSETSLSLGGRFDASQVDIAQTAFAKLNSPAVVDCQSLDYISSAGIGVFLSLAQRHAGSGVRVRLINVNAQIRKIFEYAGLTQVFDLE
jgi:anti-sigma B factor antagonist